MQIIIKDIPKLSVNSYNSLHWAKKKQFKDTLRLLVYASTKQRFKGGYELYFKFYFKGRLLDTINVANYCKIIEDALFRQDNQNRKICIEVFKGKRNYCELAMIKI